jgi:ATP-binding cassette subfamily B protein/subfamily B ATP-binding cassette protein MsbA
VCFNGQDIRAFGLKDIRSRIAMVLQQPYLMPASIAANIAYGRPDATMQQIEDAARAASAFEFIRALPEGFDTVIGERGQTLSGGERQRIAIARALLNDAPVVILDEPTSALDGRSERAVMTAFEQLTRDRTTIIIAHRLSTARSADRIVFLEGGRIVESGTHEQLIRAGGRYCRFHNIQSTATQGVAS